MIVISDTSPIANLIVIDRLTLLHKVFSKIIIPEKVYSEILLLEKYNYRLEDFKSADWISRKSIKDTDTFNELVKSLDSGEAEAITLAKELHVDYLLIDEKKGRKIAHTYGIKTVGLLGVLLKAKELKHISELKTILDQLRNEADFWINDKLYNQLLKMANE